MIVLYMLDYGTHPCTRTSGPVSVRDYGLFDDSALEAASGRRSQLVMAYGMSGLTVCPTKPVLTLGHRYEWVIVWYSNTTPGRRAILDKTFDSWRIEGFWGPGPSSENDWPPISDRTGLVPITTTDEPPPQIELTNFVPPEVPRDATYDQGTTSAWWTVLGAGALAAAGIGGYFLTRWAVNRKS